MDWLHGILNLAGLLLWITWRAGTMPHPKPRNSFTGPAPQRGPIFKHSWIYLAALVALLGLRAIFYHQFGPGLDWIPSLNLINESPHFFSELFPRILAYSVLSFVRWLVAGYFCLALLATIRPQTEASITWKEFLKSQFGWLGGLPSFVYWLMAIGLAVGVHIGETEWMKSVGVLGETSYRLQHILALITLDLRATVYLVMILLALHLLNSYVYFGEQSFWKNVNKCGNQLLRPLRILPLEFGKIDLAPFIAFALAFGLSFVLRHEQLAKWLGATN